ncbi:nose resistant to fluoxetine protein 6 [Rhipicephalus microplus]|uniref:nose resistant to fluoxetine protein 6 n=1 Tax=Rhipicephalus microplus TaxID=6941 RepID=UPI003F6C0F51
MALGKQGRIGAVWKAFVSMSILLESFAHAATAHNVSITLGHNVSDTVAPASLNSSAGAMEEINYQQVLRDVVAAGLSKVPRSLVRKLLAADVRFECSTALLRTMKALQNLEPWALRIIDATGKYPSGAFEVSRVDLGAFDECLETTVRDRNGDVLSRGQYCNLLIYVDSATAQQAILNSISDTLSPRLLYFGKYGAVPGDPLGRLGVCYIDDCNQHDLQAMVNAVSPRFARLEVSNCVTGERRPWNKSQIAIVIFAAILLVVIVISTLVDHFDGWTSEWRKNHGLLFQVAVAFSAKSNTRFLLHAPSKDKVEQHSLQFFHGVRSLTVMHIVFGHTHMTTTETYARLLGLFENTTQWQNMIIPAAFNGVDTFFFLSGFLLCHTVSKQKANKAAVFIIAVVRRLIRMCIPLFFVIMWFYLLPRIVNGPDTETFFQRFYADMSEHWWQFLLQIRNFHELSAQQVFAHCWYLSADFQLFVVSLLTLLIFRRRNLVTLAAFAVLSLLGCAIATWTMARSNLLPFILIPFPNYARMMNTMNYYYILPFYHAVCYFSGCMTSLIVTDFGKRKISKTLQLAGWCASVSCSLFCVFVKFSWYLEENPTTKNVDMTVAFFDRILWSVSLAWITLACSTGRGGPVSKFLSWNAFLPLSKLAYGVYLIHMPFIELMMHSSRERVYFSEFSQVTLLFAVLVWCFLLSYLAFIACEAPTAALDKLVFGWLMRGGCSRRQQQQEQLEGGAMNSNTNGVEGK